jgi:hypothetical protein
MGPHLGVARQFTERCGAIENHREAEAFNLATHFEDAYPLLRQNSKFELLRDTAEQKANGGGEIPAAK